MSPSSLPGGSARDYMRKVLIIIVVITLVTIFIPIVTDILPTAQAPTIYVDDDNTGPEDGSQAKPYNTIQEAVDAAQPGDTVFVSNGTYYEDVYINKTINLTGINRDNTTINSTNVMGIYVEYADYVNVSGFTVVNGSWAGIRFRNSNNSLIENNRIEKNEYGIQIITSNNTLMQNNIASNNSDYNGIYLDRSTNISVKNNICLANAVDGIYVYDDCRNNIIINNNFSNNYGGIHLSINSDNNYIANNVLYTNSEYGIFVYDSVTNMLVNNTLSGNKKGIYIRWNSNGNDIINTSITSSQVYDIGVSWNSYLHVLNTAFNKTKSYFNTIDSIIDTQWFLHVKVIDYLGNPVPNAQIKIEDNLNSDYNQTLLTDSNGQIKWLTITEYIEQDTDGNTIGEKKYHTPHKIVAWNDTLVGYAQPFIDESKTVTIVLYNGTLLDLEPGWNLVSLPRIQSDTNLQTVLQSIEGQCDAAQWYNITDSNDPWKHHHISKPSNLNDLDEINHTMGLWVHITDPGGTILVVFGDELPSTQNITLYSGWNLVGFPSKTGKTRDIALGTLNFGSDVDSIWTFNSTTQQWVELNESIDYFEVGYGYWLHSKVEKVWNVPL